MGHRVRDLTNTVTQGDLIPQYMLVDAAGNPIDNGQSDGGTHPLQMVLLSPGGTRFDAAAGQADGSTATRALWMAQSLFNGATFDRQRGNLDTAALITAAGLTTGQNSADQTNYNGRGVNVVLDMTVVGTGSVTLTIQGKDAASGKYYTLLTGAAVVTNSTNVYAVFPGAPATANVSANAQLPRIWRISVAANNANATTYTVGASVIV